MKKIISFLIILSSLFTAVYAAPIYSYKEDIPISSSITLTKVQEFYADYNLSYSYIKADLTDEATSLKLLKSPEGTDVLDTVENLASSQDDIVAAMNGDFFSVFSGNKGFALGIEIEDGKLIQSPINPSTMATISYLDNAVSMSYLDFHIMVVAPNWQYQEVRHLNKHTTYYGDILMYTSDFNGGMSPAPGGNVLEVVVEDGKVTEFRRNMPPVQIPENGCVLVVSEGSTMFFANNFNVGDAVKFDYYLTPDILNAETAFGGGAMLVSEGKAVDSYSHTVAGNHPRSAIGVDKDGTTLYLLTVDGRQEGSRGMRMGALSDLMVSLGCYTAVNLDGGGSSNMVASTVWYDKLHTVNSPIENRKVINAVGLEYNKPVGKPHGIMLENQANAVFIGQPASITSAVYDENMRPIDEKITWSSDSGTVKNGVFTPDTGGMATVTATCGDAEASTEIFVVDEISGIDVPSHIHLDVNQNSSFDISVFDEDGHFVPVTNTKPFKITSSDPSVASVSGNKIYAKSDGTAIISVEKDGAASYISVAVGSGEKPFTDGFETASGYFKGYPSSVGGSFELSNEYLNSGNYSGKLSFDFTDEGDETKGAYFTLTKDVPLHNSADSVSVYFYSEEYFDHELRAQFVDGNGKIFISSFGDDYESGKWQRLTATIPDSAVRPLSLDRIYALYTSGDKKDSGSVYIDDLSFVSNGEAKFDAAPANVYTDTVNGDSSNGQFVVGTLRTGENTVLSGITNNAITKYVSSKPQGALLSEINTFYTYEDKNALYINLDTSGGGIRNTDASQWNSMVSAIDTTQKKNVFILSGNSVFGENEFENKVLRDYLASVGKNVFVITGGGRNTYKNIDGVKYFTIGNNVKETVTAAHLKNYSCLEFNFGKYTTFKWKSIY